MLSYLGNAAEFPHSQDCKQVISNDLTSHICSTICPIARSMSYIAGALSPRPASAKSMLSLPSTQSSILEVSTPEELSDSECATSDTRATSVATDPKRKRTSGSSVKFAPKTILHLAHPPPISIHKHNLHIRPRVLLQLQRVTETARPTPILEVLPSFVFASRLARRFPRTFKGKAGLGADDLVIVGSEDYRTDGSDGGELEGLFEGDRGDKREIIAAICQSAKDGPEKKERAEICLNSGPPWTASRLSSGAYEFVSTDEHGLRNVARWVPKQPRGTQRTTTGGRERSYSEEKKFNFSLLNPNSRRHAIIASLDRQSVEISTKYIDPPALQKDVVPSTPKTSLSSAFEDSATRDPIEVSPALRSLIIVTGIFVSFQEGFSSLFKHSDSVPNSPTLGSKHQRRTLSLTSSQFRNDQVLSPTGNSLGGLHRSRSKLKHTNSASAVPLASNCGQMDTGAGRTTSLGGVFMQRVQGRNNTAVKANSSPSFGDFPIDDAERSRTDKDNCSASRTSSLYSEATSPGLEPDHDLEALPNSGLDVVEEDSVTAPATVMKSRRLSKFFGLSRRVGRDR